MDELFTTLNKAGIKRKDLYLAWDFTVGSEQRITERMLGIRDDAFAALGDEDLSDMTVPAGSSAPPFTVPDPLRGGDAQLDRRSGPQRPLGRR